jgi:hypothetical protein
LGTGRQNLYNHDRVGHGDRVVPHRLN